MILAHSGQLVAESKSVGRAAACSFVILGALFQRPEATYHFLFYKSKKKYIKKKKRERGRAVRKKKKKKREEGERETKDEGGELTRIEVGLYLGRTWMCRKRGGEDMNGKLRQSTLHREETKQNTNEVRQ